PGEVGMEACAQLEQRPDRAAHLEPSAGRREDARDEAQQRRLTRSVPADEADRGSRLDVQRDVPQRPDLLRLHVPPANDGLLQRHVSLRVDAKATAHVLELDLAGVHEVEGTPTTSRHSSANPRTNAGSSFSDSMRSRSSPSSAARSRASTSMSHRISRWSLTKPIGQTRTRSTPRACRSSSSSRMSGPSHGSPVALALWKANDQESRPARSAISCDVSSSWS